MSFARISTNRFSAVLRTRCSGLSGVSLRTFASNSEATGKLLDILEKYRQEHYQQTIPSRFVKDILKYTDTNKDGLWSKSEFEEFLGTSLWLVLLACMDCRILLVTENSSLSTLNPFLR